VSTNKNNNGREHDPKDIKEDRLGRQFESHKNRRNNKHDYPKEQSKQNSFFPIKHFIYKKLTNNKN
jgi:hypothetical protein